MASKVCTKCKKKKTLDKFGKTAYNTPQSWCKECVNDYRKNVWKVNNPNYDREHSLSRNYGLTIDEYDKKLQEQCGVCAICGKKETVKNQYGIRRLNVDHNHITNKNRGLLCNKCNQALGLLNIDKEGIKLLLNAVDYIRKYDE